MIGKQFDLPRWVAISRVLPICNHSFSFMGGVGKKEITKLGYEKHIWRHAYWVPLEMLWYDNPCLYTGVKKILVQETIKQVHYKIMVENNQALTTSVLFCFFLKDWPFSWIIQHDAWGMVVVVAKTKGQKVGKVLAVSAALATHGRYKSKRQW